MPQINSTPRKAARNSLMLEQLRDGLNFRQIGALHHVHPTRVKQILLDEIAREQRRLHEALVLVGQAKSSILLSPPLQQAISRALGQDQFDQESFEARYEGSIVALLKEPGISCKHLKELDTWRSSHRPAR